MTDWDYAPVNEQEELNEMAAQRGLEILEAYQLYDKSIRREPLYGQALSLLIDFFIFLKRQTDEPIDLVDLTQKACGFAAEEIADAKE